MKNNIKQESIHKIINDSYYRSLVTAFLGSGWNFIYAIYQLILAYTYKSYWFLTMGVYYFIVFIMRTLALRTSKLDTNKSKSLKTNAGFMFLLAFVFTGIVCLTIVDRKNEVKNKIIIIAMAAYTFYCVISAIINLFKTNKNNITTILIRNISMVYALGSLFGLEAKMLATYGNANDSFTFIMEILSGLVIFIIIVLFGINSLLLYKRTYNIDNNKGA